MNLPRSHILAAACALLIILCGCSAKAQVERYTQRGDAFYEKKEYDKARLEYLNAFRKGARDAQLLTRLSDCFLNEGDPKAAFQLLLEARKAHPTDVAVRTKVAAFLVSARNFEEARKEVEELLKVAPDNRDANIILADCATNRVQVNDLTARYQQLQNTYPTNSVFPFVLGMLAHKSGNLSTAKAYYEKAKSLDPKESKVYMALAEVAKLQHDTNAADAYFQQASALAPAKSWERIKMAENLIKSKRNEEGEKILLETLQQEPEFVQALNMLVDSLLSRNQLDEAEKYNAKSLAASPNNHDALLNSGRIKIARRDGAGAVTTLQEMTKAFPRDAVGHYNLALAQLLSNDSTNALASLDATVALDPNNVQAVTLRAELQIQKGNIDNAIIELQRIAKEAPNVSQTHFLLASALQRKGQFDQALQIYAELGKQLPQDPRPPYFSGLVYQQQRKLAEARTSYESALKISPTYLGPVEQLVNLDLAEKKGDAAMARIDGYLKQYPDKPALFLLKAKILAANEKTDDAIAAVQSALKIDPDLYPAQTSLVSLYMAAGKQDEAISKLQSMIKENSKDYAALLQLAMLQEAKKDFKAARASYETLLAAKPTAAVALNNLANIVGDQFNDADQAFEYARKARELAPAEPAVADTFGWALWRRGDYARALTAIQESADKLGQLPEVQYHLGMAHYMLRNEPAATAALEQAVKPDAQYNGKDRAELALAVLKINPANADGAAVQKLQNAVAQRPSDLVAQVRLGQVYENQKKWTEAAQAYQAAMKVNPRMPDVLARLAVISTVGLNDPKQALEYAKQSWALDPNPALAGELGQIGYRAGDFRWASGVLAEARRAQPRDPAIAFYTAMSSYGAGAIAQARDILQDSLQQNSAQPPLAKPALTLVSFQLDPSKATEAAAAAQSALAQDATFPPALLASGLLAEQKKDYPRARALYEQALKAFPNHVAAQRQLGLLLAETGGDDETASRLLSAAKTQLPGDAQITKGLGQIAYRRGDYKEASNLLRDAAIALRDDAEIYYLLGQAQHQLNDRAAKETLTRALKMDPKSGMAAEATKVLAELKK